jgi:hypothetical protein
MWHGFIIIIIIIIIIITANGKTECDSMWHGFVLTHVAGK